MDAASPHVLEEPPARDWSLLPLDALASVFVIVGAVDVLMSAGLVCRSWLEAAKFPDVWRTVDMENHKLVRYKGDDVLCAMAKAAVDRSNGQLREFTGKHFVDVELTTYIVERSPSLTILRLVSCYYDIFSEPLASVIKESPMLQLRSLELDDTELTVGELATVIENCPVLEFLRVRNCFRNCDKDLDALQAKFLRMKTMTLDFDDCFRFPYFSDWESNWDYASDYEDEMTEWL